MLSNITNLGRFKNVQTGKCYNIKKGKMVQRSIDLLFYIRSGKRVFIPDSDFYSTYEKID